jgi:hypothetical protein
MAVERWVAGSGVGLTWTNCFQAADINSLASGSSVLSSSGDIANDTALDIFCDLSCSLGSITPVAPNNLSVFLYPLNQDGTTYGDNQLVAGTQAAKTPSPSQWVGNLVFPLVAQVQTGQLNRIILPPGKFRFCVQNNIGVVVASSANTIAYRTYNRQVV